jgi:hypothetical protein
LENEQQHSDFEK